MGISALTDLRRQLERGGEEVERRSRGWRRDLREGGSGAQEKLQDLWSQIEDLFQGEVRPTARRLAREAGSHARLGRDYALDAADQLRSATRNHPLAAIGIAVAATWLVSGLLRRRD